MQGVSCAQAVVASRCVMVRLVVHFNPFAIHVPCSRWII